MMGLPSVNFVPIKKKKISKPIEVQFYYFYIINEVNLVIEASKDRNSVFVRRFLVSLFKIM